MRTPGDVEMTDKLLTQIELARSFPVGRIGIGQVLKSICARWPWLRHVFADGGYAGPKLRGALQKVGKFTLEAGDAAAPLDAVLVGDAERARRILVGSEDPSGRRSTS